MIYFFYGDEEFNISNEIKGIKSKLDPNFIEMSYKEFNNPKFPDLIAAISSQPLMFGKMLIVIDCLKYFKSKNEDGFDDKQLKQLENSLENIGENIDIIFSAIYDSDPKKGGIDKRKKIFKILSKYNSKEFLKIPAYKTAELESWINSQCKSKKLKINPDAVSQLLLQVGPELRLLNSEIEKLKVFVQDNIATNEIVKEICVNNEDLFAFIDNLIEGNKAKALLEYKKLLMTTHPLSILFTLHKDLSSKIMIKAYMKSKSSDEIAQLIGWHPYRTKLQMAKLKNVSLKNLVKLKQNLTEAEYRIKSGKLNLSPEREVEYAILQ